MSNYLQDIPFQHDFITVTSYLLNKTIIMIINIIIITIINIIIIIKQGTSL